MTAADSLGHLLPSFYLQSLLNQKSHGQVALIELDSKSCLISWRGDQDPSELQPLMNIANQRISFKNEEFRRAFERSLHGQPNDQPSIALVFLPQTKELFLGKFFLTKKQHWFSFNIDEPQILIEIYRKGFQEPPQSLHMKTPPNSLPLTTTEARIAGMLCSGYTLTDISKLNSITYQTAKSHLRSIFSKTDTHCQNELVTKLTRS